MRHSTITAALLVVSGISWIGFVGSQSSASTPPEGPGDPVTASVEPQEEEAAVTSDAKKALQKVYMDFLTEEGFRPTIDPDGDIQFKREGFTYFIGVAEGDPQFFRLVLPHIWPIESEEERAKVLTAIDYSNRMSKAAKIYTLGDNVWGTVELFVSSPGDYEPLFERILGSLDAALELFVEKMRE
jgi:hypothetical protein